jgi:hypothetical protein
MPKGTESVVTGLPEHEADMLTGKRHVEHVLQQDEDDAQEEAESELDDSEADDLVPELLADEVPLPFPREDLDLWELRHARRRGGESSYRHQRKNQFYPLYVDPEAGQVVRAGESIPLDQEPSFEPVDGLVPLWPIDKEGNQRCWRYIPESMQRKIDGGFVVLGQTSADGKSWTVNYWAQKTQRKKYKTVWWSTSHDAGTHGTSMLHKLLGDRTAFPFPKSLYAVRDTLLTVVRDRPNALILDFFAGSGTTLHATALINALDGGQRRCILVSNNEVAAKSSDRLLRAGHLPGDEEYEKHGIFWKATRPRCEAAITGRDARGKPAGRVLFELPGSALQLDLAILDDSGRVVVLGEAKRDTAMLENLRTNVERRYAGAAPDMTTPKDEARQLAWRLWTVAPDFTWLIGPNHRPAFTTSTSPLRLAPTADGRLPAASHLGLDRQPEVAMMPPPMLR